MLRERHRDPPLGNGIVTESDLRLAKAGARLKEFLWRNSAFMASPWRTMFAAVRIGEPPLPGNVFADGVGPVPRA
jgi:hypothetical protein